MAVGRSIAVGWFHRLHQKWFPLLSLLIRWAYELDSPATIVALRLERLDQTLRLGWLVLYSSTETYPFTQKRLGTIH
jgi:hypothetical protein